MHDLGDVRTALAVQARQAEWVSACKTWGGWQIIRAVQMRFHWHKGVAKRRKLAAPRSTFLQSVW
jgi:hypothetical protein